MSITRKLIQGSIIHFIIQCNEYILWYPSSITMLYMVCRAGKNHAFRKKLIQSKSHDFHAFITFICFQNIINNFIINETASSRVDLRL